MEEKISVEDKSKKNITNICPALKYQPIIPKQFQSHKNIPEQISPVSEVKNYFLVIRLGLVFLDMILVNIGFLCSFWIRYGWPFPEINFKPYKGSFIVLTLIHILSLALFKTYKGSFRSSWDMLVKISKGLVVATLLSVVFIYTFRIIWGAFPTSVFAISFFVNLLLIYKFNQWILKKNKKIKKRVVVVGKNKIDLDEISIKKATIERYQIANFEELLKYKNAHEIVICDKIQDKKDIDFLIYAVQRFGINVTFSPSCYMSLLSDKVNGSSSFSLLKTFIGKQTDFEEFLMRTLDIVGSVMFSIVSLPIIILVSLLIKISSFGSVIYKQRRVGKDGKVFTLYKFRTMVNNAEKESGPVWAAKEDFRVTPLGHFLRSTRIDELPQLWNVIRGDMSLVGPRPERLYFVLQHKALREIRLAVKPGLTGLAQIRGHYDLHPKHKIKYDYLYIQKRTFLLNVYILAKTIPIMFLRKGQ